MKHKTELATKEGAKNSRIVCALITEDYFDQEACLKELRWAKEARVFIQPVMLLEDTSRTDELKSKAPDDLRAEFNDEKETIWLDLDDNRYWKAGVDMLKEVLKDHQSDTTGEDGGRSRSDSGRVASAGGGKSGDGGDAKTTDTPPKVPFHSFGQDLEEDLKFCVKIAYDNKYPEEVRKEYQEKIAAIIASQERSSGGGNGGRNQVRIDYRNEATGEDGSAQVDTNDEDAWSTEPKKRVRWLKTIARKLSRERGWKYEDTVVEVDDGLINNRTDPKTFTSALSPATVSGSHDGSMTGSSRSSGKKKPKLPATIHFEFRNTKFGIESAHSAVQSNDPDAVSDDEKRREKWRMRVLKDLARKEGWAIEDTELIVDEDSAKLAREVDDGDDGDTVSSGTVSSRPQSSSGGVDRDLLPSIRIEFENKATGEIGSAAVQTNDPDAVSDDPRRRELWRKRVLRKHAHEEGWKVEDTVVTIDEDSLQIALQEKKLLSGHSEGKGTAAGSIAASKGEDQRTKWVRGRFNQDRVVFERAAALAVLLRRNKPSASPLSFEQMEETLLNSAGVTGLETGNWMVRDALRELFRLQRLHPSRKNFTEDEVCVSEEDGNSCALIELLLRMLEKATSAEEDRWVSQAEAAGRNFMPRAGVELRLPTDALRKHCVKLAGSGFIRMAQKAAGLITRKDAAADAEWEIFAKDTSQGLAGFEERRWRVQNACFLMRSASVTTREELTGDVDARSAVLCEYIRRLVLEKLGMELGENEIDAMDEVLPTPIPPSVDKVREARLKAVEKQSLPRGDEHLAGSNPSQPKDEVDDLYGPAIPGDSADYEDLYGESTRSPSSSLSPSSERMKELMNSFDEQKLLGTLLASNQNIHRLLRSKLMFVGSARVGKTSLKMRLTRDKNKVTTEDQSTRGIELEATTWNGQGNITKSVERDLKSLQGRIIRRIMKKFQASIDEKNRMTEIENIYSSEDEAIGTVLDEMAEDTNLERQTKKIEPARNSLKDYLDVDDDSDGLNEYKMTILDFAGQRMYYQMHHLFITAKLSIYVVVFNLSIKSDTPLKELDEGCGLTQLDNLLFWLNSIHAKAPEAPILIVGTHSKGTESTPLDERERKKRVEELQEKFEGKGFYGQLVGDIRCVDSKEDGDEPFEEIRNELHRLQESELPGFNEKVPYRWLKFLSEMEDFSKDHIRFDEAREVANNLKFKPGDNDSELKEMLKKFTDVGLLMYYDEPGLRDLVVLRPRWLLEHMKDILCKRTLREREKNVMGRVKEKLNLLACEGRLYPEPVLGELWSNTPSDERRVILNYMEHFNLCCRLPSYWGKDPSPVKLEDRSCHFDAEEYVVPALLREVSLCDELAVAASQWKVDVKSHDDPKGLERNLIMVIKNLKSNDPRYKTLNSDGIVKSSLKFFDVEGCKVLLRHAGFEQVEPKKWVHREKDRGKVEVAISNVLEALKQPLFDVNEEVWKKDESRDKQMTYRFIYRGREFDKPEAGYLPTSFFHSLVCLLVDSTSDANKGGFKHLYKNCAVIDAEVYFMLRLDEAKNCIHLTVRENEGHYSRGKTRKRVEPALKKLSEEIYGVDWRPEILCSQPECYGFVPIPKCCEFMPMTLNSPKCGRCQHICSDNELKLWTKSVDDRELYPVEQIPDVPERNKRIPDFPERNVECQDEIVVQGEIVKDTLRTLSPGKKYHFFICHHQGSGGDQSKVLCKELEKYGFNVWYDNKQPAGERNLEGMLKGVEESECLLLFLSGRMQNEEGYPLPPGTNGGKYEGTFTRFFCHEEMNAAHKFGLKVIGVMEAKEHSGRPDFKQMKHRALNYEDGKPAHEKYAKSNLHLLDDITFTPFRRTEHEERAMIQEIITQFSSSNTYRLSPTTSSKEQVFESYAVHQEKREERAYSPPRLDDKQKIKKTWSNTGKILVGIGVVGVVLLAAVAYEKGKKRPENNKGIVSSLFPFVRQQAK